MAQKSKRKAMAEAKFPTQLYNENLQGLPPKDSLVVQVLLEVVNAKGRLDASMVKDILAAAQEVSYELGWESRPKSKREIAAQELEELEFGGEGQ